MLRVQRIQLTEHCRKIEFRIVLKVVVVAVVVVAFFSRARILGECLIKFIPCLHFFIFKQRLACAR